VQVNGAKDAKSQTIAGDLEGKFTDPKNGVVFTQTWTTSNVLKSQLELEGQVAKGPFAIPRLSSVLLNAL
jgi:voltage-dependent anion channel protein 2